MVMNLNELNKVQKYLMNKKISYRRTDIFGANGIDEFHQIEVYNKEMKVSFRYESPSQDVICITDEGMLEVYGSIVPKEDEYDSVLSFLNAEDVIKLVEMEGK